eukprot:CAMPEP_0197659260 /NCGR_PEP_ID=MMETSP1338-20131121/46912_1 /TAXON_ID=43686 ORGANISM="Pelagodinium beii, Strain RCC1491" /NCGR_SAMPLE_ID=MMETSP1338 /ASSEMBLY_ACC=CAM_ASM_000754 /LENGTH=34 /DNA_ID= /DNA_START= /DNA_END= /DNA_ORIENTATION=
MKQKIADSIFVDLVLENLKNGEEERASPLQVIWD